VNLQQRVAGETGECSLRWLVVVVVWVVLVDLLENSLLVRWVRCWNMGVPVLVVDGDGAVRGLRLLPAFRIELVSLMARDRFSWVGGGGGGGGGSSGGDDCCRWGPSAVAGRDEMGCGCGCCESDGMFCREKDVWWDWGVGGRMERLMACGWAGLEQDEISQGLCCSCCLQLSGESELESELIGLMMG
jgi:hypothetical protein